jgi:hypothetical protein
MIMKLKNQWPGPKVAVDMYLVISLQAERPRNLDSILGSVQTGSVDHLVFHPIDTTGLFLVDKANTA